MCIYIYIYMCICIYLLYIYIYIYIYGRKLPASEVREHLYAPHPITRRHHITHNIL